MGVMAFVDHLFGPENDIAPHAGNLLSAGSPMTSPITKQPSSLTIHPGLSGVSS